MVAASTIWDNAYSTTKYSNSIILKQDSGLRKHTSNLTLNISELHFVHPVPLNEPAAVSL
jgi:hypothetical protein